MDNTTWDAPTRRIVALLLGGVFIFVIYLTRPVWPFLIIAGLIAFILAPIISFLNIRLRFPKGLAIALAYLLFIILLLIVPLIITPALVSAFAALRFDPAAVVPLVRSYQIWTIETLEMYRTLEILGITTDLSPFVAPAIESLSNITPSSFVPSLASVIAYIPTTIEFTWQVAAGIFGTLLSVTLALTLTLLYSIYLSATAGNMIQKVFQFVPPAYKSEIAKLGSRIQKVWNAYLRGQLTLAIIIGLLTWWSGVTVGLPGAFALGVIAGAMEILPNIGPVLAAIPALLVALLQGSGVLDVTNPTFFFIVMGIYIVIQQIENHFVVPKVLGDAVELSPLVIMVGVVVGFSVGGILGALIAAPVMATGREVVAYAYAKVLMQDPYPPEEEVVQEKTKTLDRAKTLWLILWHKLSSQKRQSAGDEPQA